MRTSVFCSFPIQEPGFSDEARLLDLSPAEN